MSEMNDLYKIDAINFNDPVMKNIFRLEKEMKDKNKYEHLEIKTSHFFSKGVYARQVLLPKGSITIGKIHKTGHLNIISIGEVTVSTKDGTDTLKGPVTFVSKPGIKRAVFAHEDTIWTTIHPTDETDVEKIEEQIIEKPPENIMDYLDDDLIKELKEIKELT